MYFQWIIVVRTELTAKFSFNLNTCAFPLVAPVCKEPDPRSIGVARGETARILCEVEANPATDLQFSWSVNTSLGAKELPEVQWTADRTRSTASYTPRSAGQFATLFCRVRNSMGLQHAPCVFHLQPAGKQITRYRLSYLLIIH